MPIITLFDRAADNGSAVRDGGGIPTMYIVGFAIAGAVILGIILWLGIHLYRKQRARQRQNQIATALFSVHGLVRESEPYLEKSADSQNSSPSAFSRSNLNSQTVMPSRVFIKTSSEQLKTERNYIIAQHYQSNNLPKPFSHTPNSRSPTPNSDNDALPVVRSAYEPEYRMSRFSATSSFNESIISITSSGGAGHSIRKVRQTFNPILPDELLISTGEELMILHSFDDGWCVTGRESGILMPQPKSLFSSSRASRALTPTLLFGHGVQGTGVGTTSGGNVELGMVPAWCFLKPEKGLRAERPMRSSSLGVTVQMDPDTQRAERNDTISWSNF